MIDQIHEEIIYDIERFILDNLPSCNGIHENVQIIKKVILENLHLINDNKAFAEKLLTEADCFKGQIPKIFLDHQVIDNTGIVASEMKGTVLSYICISLAKNLAISYSGLKKRLIEIEETSTKLQQLLEIDGESGIVLAGLISNDMVNLYHTHMKTKGWKEQESQLSRLENATKGLKFLATILSTFNDTKIAEWMQFGKSGPKENLALDYWVKSVAEIWVGQLGRNLSYSKDSLSGREKFLRFAEACFVEVHPSLGDDAVRNAYEKLRKRGKLDYLYENSG